MDQAWTMPAGMSFGMIGSAAMEPVNMLRHQDWIDRTPNPLRKPRGRPPLRPSPTTAKHAQEEPAGKRACKRKNVRCSQSELREQHLHRNRMAASKYREKHKKWSETLAERCNAESEKRRHLQELTRSLKEEVLSLKEQAIQQSGCDCMIMKLYLEHQTVNLLGLLGGSPVSPWATNSQDSISPTSSTFTSSFDDCFFSDLI
jgi:hypothetical protein